MKRPRRSRRKPKPETTGELAGGGGGDEGSIKGPAAPGMRGNGGAPLRGSPGLLNEPHTYLRLGTAGNYTDTRT